MEQSGSDKQNRVALLKLSNVFTKKNSKENREIFSRK